MNQPNTPTADEPTGGPRAQTAAWQGLANRVVRGLLRTPLLSRLLGQRLITVYAVGRKSGRRYAIPVAYLRQGQTLVIGTPFGWVRNLRTGDPVDIRLLGRRRSADVRVFTDADAVVARYEAMARANRQFAKFNQIGTDRAGNPDPADVQLAWAAGARAVELTPR